MMMMLLIIFGQEEYKTNRRPMDPTVTQNLSDDSRRRPKRKRSSNTNRATSHNPSHPQESAKRDGLLVPLVLSCCSRLQGQKQNRGRRQMRSCCLNKSNPTVLLAKDDTYAKPHLPILSTSRLRQSTVACTTADADAALLLPPLLLLLLLLLE